MRFIYRIFGIKKSLDDLIDSQRNIIEDMKHHGHDTTSRGFNYELGRLDGLLSIRFKIEGKK